MFTTAVPFTFERASGSSCVSIGSKQLTTTFLEAKPSQAKPFSTGSDCYMLFVPYIPISNNFVDTILPGYDDDAIPKKHATNSFHKTIAAAIAADKLP
mmetsp:Transcript_130558/g.194449  ORF Transcript_130558/g.194449 Transcript_130558/m.194449 type:complete len:98 (-) Transcript_130558:403-696(-)